MEEEKKENQSEGPDSRENSQETRRNGPARHSRVKEEADIFTLTKTPFYISRVSLCRRMPVTLADAPQAAGSMQAFTSLSPKALSAVLHQAARPGPGPSRDPGPEPSRDPPHLEQLQAELRDLRDQFGRMKSQHNKEIQLLMSELDEEKKIRLTLQMEVQRMKKHMSK